MDTIDHKIVELLMQNARMPIADLSRSVNLSRNAVKNRLAKLQKNNVIKGFTALLGDGAPAAQPTIALIMVQRKDRMRGNSVQRFALSCDEVKSCFVMSGDLDIVLKVQASSHERVNEIWQQICALPEVEDTSTTFVLSTTKNDLPF